MRSGPTGSGLREHLLLLGKFLRNPRSVGAVAPSSQTLARAMVDGLELDGETRVVELGPGTGAFTREILKRIGPSARYLAIDREPAFVERLRTQWPAAEFVCSSAVALPTLAVERGLTPIDHVVSGLPFASLPGPVTKEILDGIDRTLRPGGTFRTFQYVHAYGLPPAVAFRRDITARLGCAPTKQLVVRNIPPAFVLTWRRLRQ
jgi:phosphatidylethanolamine/phosphatidyl-N-methylethanolamine N-methyltransferase